MDGANGITIEKTSCMGVSYGYGRVIEKQQGIDVTSLILETIPSPNLMPARERLTVFVSEKLQDGLMCSAGLVGFENVAGARNQHEFGAGNTFRD